MSKLKSYLMIDAEYGQKLLQDYQKECDSYNDLSPEEIRAEEEKMLTDDPAYSQFINEVDSAPF